VLGHPNYLPDCAGAALVAAADWARAGKLPLPTLPFDFAVALWMRDAAFAVIADLLMLFVFATHGRDYLCYPWS